MYERNVTRIENLVSKQNAWRGATINLIASENVLSNRARKVMGSDFVHRYAEGHPGERYYQGTEIIDEIEARLKKRLKSLFCCRQVDVRPISGTLSNDAIFSQYINPGDVVMVNSTPGGGHISHQLAIDVADFGGGDEVARHLTDNNIILNMNLLPFEPLSRVTSPAGIRIGVLEMTRVGMKEAEMETIASFLKKCLMDGKYVGEEVTEFRKAFQKVQYSFDYLESDAESGTEPDN